jgi:hypothetical protein
VTSRGHVYDIALAGEETIDGRLCYRLVLHPEIDPERYPLRALWVEESSYEIVQLTYERPYDRKHGHALVQYGFAPIGPERIWTIVRIEAEATSERVEDDVRDITFPPAEPAAYFATAPP